MLLFCLTGSSFAANCPATGVNVKGENSGVRDKAYAWNDELQVFGTSRSLGLWGSFVALTYTSTWYFESEAYQCGLSGTPWSDFWLDGVTSWGYTSKNYANVNLIRDYRYRYTSYSDDDYFCCEMDLCFKIPNDAQLYYISGDYTYTCQNSGCKDLSYSRTYACQPTRSKSPSPTASRSMTPTPTETYATEFFTPGMQQELYSIRRVFLAISYFVFALEA
jgi:hypothetical protein